MNEEHGKKCITNIPKTFQHLAEPLTNNSHNAYALLMGQQYNNNYIIALDVDNKENCTVLNGIPFIQQLFMIHNYEPNTPTAKTGNDGLHYLFTVTQKQFTALKSSYTELLYENKHYAAVDVKVKNQFLLVEPTKYKVTKNSETICKCYTWLNNNFSHIEPLPEFLYNLLLNQHSPYNNNNNTNINTNNTAHEPTTINNLL